MEKKDPNIIAYVWFRLYRDKDVDSQLIILFLRLARKYMSPEGMQIAARKLISTMDFDDKDYQADEIYK